MDYVWIGVIILSTVLAHELGHLIAMRKCDIWVTELGIGLPLGPRIGWTFRSKKYKGKSFAISLYPLLLLGAFVRAEKEKYVRRLSYHDQAFIYGAGIIANLFWITSSITLFGIMEWGRLPPLVAIWGGLASSVAILWFARPITQYLFPLASIGIFFWVLVIFGEMSIQKFLQDSGGVVALAQMGKSFSGDHYSLALFGVIVSTSLALVNLLPIYPLDGGQIMRLLGEKYFPRTWNVFQKLGIALFVFLLIVSFAGDIRRLGELFL